MTASITWAIDWMQCKPTEGTYTDVVVNAGWTCTGVQEVGGIKYVGRYQGSCEFLMTEGQFTPYNQLTQEQVLGWCWASGVSKDATEAAVQEQIEIQITPPVITPPLPWANPSA